MSKSSELQALADTISCAVPRDTAVSDMLPACGFIIATTLSGLQISTDAKHAHLEHLIVAIRHNVR